MDAIEFRRHLHRNPELSFKERETAKFIDDELTKAGIEHRVIAGTGILAKIEGKGDLTKSVVLRADIDALPINERNTEEWASQCDGVMHACGHDMHAAILYGVLAQLAEKPNFEGTIFGIFQPGEELNPGGASLVLAEDPFDGYKVKAVIGQHVDSQLEVGEFGFRSGKFMAASDELRFTVNGVGGHGAMRALIKDPVVAAAEIITRLTQLNNEECVLSIGKVIAQGATNVIPDSVYMEGTLRTFDEREREIIRKRIHNVVNEIFSRTGVETIVDISQGYPCVVNDPMITLQAVSLTQSMKYKMRTLLLRTTAEDFGFYSARYPSLFYRLGVGAKSGKSHTPTFNPDEGAIKVGVEFMVALALEIIKK